MYCHSISAKLINNLKLTLRKHFRKERKNERRKYVAHENFHNMHLY